MSLGADSRSEAVKIDLSNYDAFVFDMDGVVTDTASLHERAWRELFDRDVLGRTGAHRPQAPFSSSDYRRHVDGRSRLDGIVAFLASRGMHLPMGTRGDPAGRRTVWGLAHRKNELFRDSIRHAGVTVFESTIRLIDRLLANGLRTAVVTASRNAAEILAAGGVADLFDVRVDGVDLEEHGVAGKPDPASFLEAARRLGVDPGRAAIVEDSAAGVEAGVRGGFALVIGVDRSDGSMALRDRGAHVVVPDLAALIVAMPTHRQAPNG